MTSAATPDAARTGSTGEPEAWRHRQEHDENWFPLHPWIQTPEHEPRGTTDAAEQAP